MSDIRGLPLLSGPPPPMETPSADDACRKCNKEFNILFARSRKCNHCGYSYCHSCSDYQAMMPRPGAVTVTGYDAVPVCAFCIELLTITAAGRHQLKTLSLAKLKKYINAYNINIDRAVEKVDLIDAIISAKGPNGCLPPANENYYRKYSVPNKPQGRPRGLFSRQQDQSSNGPPPPTPPRTDNTPEFARPDLAPDGPPPLQSQSQSQPQEHSTYPPPRPPRPQQQQQQQQYSAPPYPPPPRSQSAYGNAPPPMHSSPPPQFHTPPQRPPPPPQGYGYPGQDYRREQPHPPPPPPPPHYSRPPPQQQQQQPHPPPPPPRQNYQPRPTPRYPNQSHSSPHPPPPPPQQQQHTPHPPPPPPRPRAASTSSPPTLDQLLSMTPASIGALGIGVLKSILFTNHVPTGQILEKGDLVKKVLGLVEDERSERERMRRTEEMEEMERVQREVERREEEQRERERREQREREREQREGDGAGESESESGDGDTAAGDVDEHSQFHPEPSSSPPKAPPAAAPPKTQGSASTLERTGLCVICQDEEANIAIVDCGHMAMCRGCSDLVMASSRECPLCRTRIVTEARLLRIFKT